MNFAENLRDVIRDKGITQKQLSDKTHIAQGNISHYINGVRTPNLYIAVQIADALGVSINELCK